MEIIGSPSAVHMRGGTGPGSFNDFSKSLQSNLNEFFWPKLSNAIAYCFKQQQKLKSLASAAAAEYDDDRVATVNFASPFVIADFGCSCAWSTVNTMHFVVKRVIDQASALTVSQHLSPAKQQQLHILAFFNDLPSNDFNTLFAHLCSSQHAPQTAGLHFMPCGLPGSFYSCLFPPRYLDIGLCTLALHNLSEVPATVRHRNSPAWNENGTWILDGCKLETVMAYKKQFNKDFTCFLLHRNEELVVGGLLFCVMIAAKVDDLSNVPFRDHNHLLTNLQSAWRQLVLEGLLEQETLDSYNMPLFMPTVDEVKEVVYSDLLREQFKVVELEYVEVERAPKCVWMESAAADGQTWGRTCETMARNFWGSLIQSHLNDEAKFEMLMERLRLVAANEEMVHRSPDIHLIVLALSRR